MVISDKNQASREAGRKPSFKEAALVVAEHVVLTDGDADDEDDTVMPGNSRLAARILAGRQSLAPSRQKARTRHHQRDVTGPAFE